MSGEQKTKAPTLEEIKSRRKKRNEAWEAKQRAFRAQTLARQTAQLRTMGEAARRNEAELGKTKRDLAVQTAQRQAAEEKAATLTKQAAAADKRAKEKHALTVQNQGTQLATLKTLRESVEKKHEAELATYKAQLAMLKDLAIKENEKTKTTSEQENERIKTQLIEFGEMVAKIKAGKFRQEDVPKTTATLKFLNRAMTTIYEGEATQFVGTIRKLMTQFAETEPQTQQGGEAKTQTVLKLKDKTQATPSAGDRHAKRTEITEAGAGIIILSAKAHGIPKKTLEDFFKYRYINAEELAKQQLSSHNRKERMSLEQGTNILLEKIAQLLGKHLLPYYGYILSAEAALMLGRNTLGRIPGFKNMSLKALEPVLKIIPLVGENVGALVEFIAKMEERSSGVTAEMKGWITTLICTFAVAYVGVLGCRRQFERHTYGAMLWDMVKSVIPSFDGLKQFALIYTAQYATNFFVNLDAYLIPMLKQVGLGFVGQMLPDRGNCLLYMKVDIITSALYFCLVGFWGWAYSTPQWSPEITKEMMAVAKKRHDRIKKEKGEKFKQRLQTMMEGEEVAPPDTAADASPDRHEVMPASTGVGGESKISPEDYAAFLANFVGTTEKTAALFEARAQAHKIDTAQADYMQWLWFLGKRGLQGATGYGVAAALGQSTWMGALVASIVEMDTPLFAPPTCLLKSNTALFLALTLVPPLWSYRWDSDSQASASPRVAVVLRANTDTNVGQVCVDGVCYGEDAMIGMKECATFSDNTAVASLSGKMDKAWQSMREAPGMDATIMSLTSIPVTVRSAQAVGAAVQPIKILAGYVQTAIQTTLTVTQSDDTIARLEKSASVANDTLHAISEWAAYLESKESSSLARRAVTILLTQKEANMLPVLGSVFTTARVPNLRGSGRSRSVPPRIPVPTNSTESQAMLESFVKEAPEMSAETKVRKGLTLLSQNQFLHENEGLSDFTFTKYIKYALSFGRRTDLTATAKKAQTVVNKALGEVVAKKDEERRASQALPITIDQRMAEAQAEAQKQLTDYLDWLRGTCRAFPEDMLGPPTNQDPAQKLGQCPADAENDVTQTLLNQISTNSNGTTVSGQGSGTGTGTLALGSNLHPPVSRPLRVSYTVPYTAPYVTRVSYTSYPPNAAPEQSRAQRPPAITRERDPERKC